MERLARLLVGAASGGVMGLLVAGLLGLGKQTTGTMSIFGTVAVILGFAGVMGLLNLRGKQTETPAPRCLLAVTLTSAALLITLLVFLIQSVQVQAITAQGGKVELPLSVWPVSRIALLLSLVLTVVGIVTSFLGWAQAAREPLKYKAGKWVAMSLLTGGAWIGLAVACYGMGYGFVFGR
jgi:hypothetical protein